MYAVTGYNSILGELVGSISGYRHNIALIGGILGSVIKAEMEQVNGNDTN